jgi:hypothetical protein
VAGEKIVAEQDSESIDYTIDNPFADWTDAALLDRISSVLPLNSPENYKLYFELRDRLARAAKNDGPERPMMTEDERLSAMCLFGSLMGMAAANELNYDWMVARLIENAIRNG